jgi:hypothetical protein
VCLDSSWNSHTHALDQLQIHVCTHSIGVNTCLRLVLHCNTQQVSVLPLSPPTTSTPQTALRGNGSTAAATTASVCTVDCASDTETTLLKDSVAAETNSAINTTVAAAAATSTAAAAAATSSSAEQHSNLMLSLTSEASAAATIGAEGVASGLALQQNGSDIVSSISMVSESLHACPLTSMLYFYIVCSLHVCVSVQRAQKRAQAHACACCCISSMHSQQVLHPA